MRGNDGNIWIIVKTSNGVQRWKLHKKLMFLIKQKKIGLKKDIYTVKDEHIKGQKII